mmetsp:Transcript_11746/g.21306  ORF Transcript_11746/g.21306 Transcript_11746/m.21306 type:complete len:226 (-) Transcript_11746:1208-1885(-)
MGKACLHVALTKPVLNPSVNPDSHLQHRPWRGWRAWCHCAQMEQSTCEGSQHHGTLSCACHELHLIPKHSHSSPDSHLQHRPWRGWRAWCHCAQMEQSTCEGSHHHGTLSRACHELHLIPKHSHSSPYSGLRRRPWGFFCLMVTMDRRVGGMAGRCLREGQPSPSQHRRRPPWASLGYQLPSASDAAATSPGRPFCLLKPCAPSGSAGAALQSLYPSLRSRGLEC